MEDKISFYLEEKAALEKEKCRNQKIHIVNSGLLKAGKSTLFNAVSGKEMFGTDVVRATVENAKVELEKCVLIDTPGLDARDDDTWEAFTGYEEADIIIFVHNIQEGELNQIEIDSISRIYRLFGNKDMFLKNSILVLTHKDEVMNSYEEIMERIEEQCGKLLGGRFSKCLCVDSISFQKGMAEDKELLKKESGIQELMAEIESRMSEEMGLGLREALFNRKKNKLLAEIDEAISLLKRTIPEREEVSASDVQKKKSEMENIQKKAIEAVWARKMILPGCGSYKSYGMARDFKEYDSEYSAREAGKRAISDAIDKIAKAAKRQALSIADEANSYINFAKVPNEIVAILSDAYEKMRKCALEADVTIRPSFNVVLRDFNEEEKNKFPYQKSELEKSHDELERVREKAGYIDAGSFSSVSEYISRYDSSLTIDSNLGENYVEKLFGGYKWKKVWTYEYDAEFAIELIRDDAQGIVDDIQKQASDSVYSAFQGIKKDLESQFVSLSHEIDADMINKIETLKKQEEVYYQKVRKIQRSIDEMESCRKEVERM